MIKYRDKQNLIDAWLRFRESDPRAKFNAAIEAVSRGTPNAFEVNVRTDDAAVLQAHAERLAYLRDEPLPSADDALDELLAWYARGDVAVPSSGYRGHGRLPKLPWRPGASELEETCLFEGAGVKAGEIAPPRDDVKRG
jgi:hypothetical protein